MKFSSSLFHRLVIGTILIFLLLRSANGIKCHSTDTNSINGTCESRLCTVYVQLGEVFQQCKRLFSACPENNPNHIFINPGSTVPYRFCCDYDWCNAIDKILPYISPSPSPSPSPTSSFGGQSSSLITSSVLSVWEAPPSPSTSSSRISQISSASNTLLAHTESYTITTASPTSEAPSASSSLPIYIIIAITVLCVVIFLFIVALVTVIFFYVNPHHVVGIALPTESEGTPTISTGSCDFSSNQELFDGTTSGSGAGLPLLVQRSIAAQVTTCHLIGKGRFGEVWLGAYKGDSVAVKIFHTKEEESWKHEVDIYQTCLIRHPNILRFIAADNKDIGIATQLWLITEYCDLGSLYEVLVNEVLEESIVFKLCLTAVSGLAHLHAEITGIEGKSAIAHRDLKSRNILVKRDYSCCIADLGLALRYNKATDTVEEPPTKRVGTRRYLSPEILDDSMNTKNFDFFKRSDMYSFGLVLWEIARRGLCGGEAEEYQLPYFDSVTPDPSFEEMKKVVVFDKRRPPFPNRWSQSKVFAELSQIIEQCWHHNGEARLTALRVKKSLSNIYSELAAKPIKLRQPDNQIQVSL